MISVALASQPGCHVGRIRRLAADRWPGSSGRWPSSMNTGEPLGAMRHRSTPPITGSIDATAEIASATMPPSHIAATACRLVNDGSR